MKRTRKPWLDAFLLVMLLSLCFFPVHAKADIIETFAGGSTEGSDARAVSVNGPPAFRSVSNAKHVLTMEVLADLQALSFRNADRLGVGTGRIYEILNREFAVYDNKRVFHEDLVKFRKLLFSSPVLDDLAVYWR